MKRIIFLGFIIFFPLSITSQVQIVDMPEPTLNSESTIFEGTIINRDSSYTDSVRLYVFDILEKDDHTYYSRLDSLGHFRFMFKCGSTVSASFYHGNDYEGFLLLEPGDTALLTLDEHKGKKDRRWVFSGAHSVWNNDMNQLSDSTRYYSLYRKVTKEWKRYTDDEDEFAFRSAVSSMQSSLEERILDSEVDDEVKYFNYLASKLYYIELLSGYAMTMTQLYIQRGMDRGVSSGFYKEAVKEDFLHYNTLLYTPLGKHLKGYASLCNEQRGSHFTYPKFLDKVDYAVKALSLLHEKNLLNERQLNAIERRLPELYEWISGLNEDLRAEQLEKMRNPMYHIKYIDEDVKGKDVYFSLVDNYEGKIILIDMWATWCMPCHVAMANMKPLKEEYKDKISFVYVTGETSSEDTWRSMIPDIKGDHYYITDSQWKDLCKALKVKSIPSYLLIDWDGLVVKQFTGFPGNDALKEEFEKLIKEREKSKIESQEGKANDNSVED